MRNAASCQHLAQKLGSLDRNGTNQNRLSLFMGCCHFLDNRMEFLFFRLINRILVINTLYRAVRRDGDNVHLVNVTELLLLGLCRTGHTSLLVKLVEEVLEGNGCQRAALTAHMYVLLRLNRLMETIGITASRHDTSGKLIDDQNLVIFYHVVLIAEHQVVGTQCQDDVVLDLQVLRIRQVLDVEEIFNLLHTSLGQVDYFIFLIDYEIACLLDLLAHDGCHLGKFC